MFIVNLVFNLPLQPQMIYKLGDWLTLQQSDIVGLQTNISSQTKLTQQSKYPDRKRETLILLGNIFI